MVQIAPFSRAYLRAWAKARIKAPLTLRGGASENRFRTQLSPGVERYSQAEGLLTSCSLGAFKRFSNLTSGSLFSGKRLQFANLRARPSNSFRFFHSEMSPVVGRAVLYVPALTRGSPEQCGRGPFVMWCRHICRWPFASLRECFGEMSVFGARQTLTLRFSATC